MSSFSAGFVRSSRDRDMRQAPRAAANEYAEPNIYVIPPVYVNEATIQLTADSMRRLERSYYHNPFPTEEEVRRLKDELRLCADHIRRWCVLSPQPKSGNPLLTEHSFIGSLSGGCKTDEGRDSLFVNLHSCCMIITTYS